MALRDIDQKSLAKELGMLPGSLSARLTGKTSFKADEIVRIAELLGVTPDDLLLGPKSREGVE